MSEQIKNIRLDPQPTWGSPRNALARLGLLRPEPSHGRRTTIAAEMAGAQGAADGRQSPPLRGATPTIGEQDAQLQMELEASDAETAEFSV